MVCTIRGKHCHYCTGWAQSIQCAVTQHTTAFWPSSCVPHTDQHLPDETANRAGSWLSCRLRYKKVVLLPTEPTIQGGCLLSFRLALSYCTHSCSKLGAILWSSSVVLNSMLTTKLLLTGRSSAATQYWASFWVVHYKFFYGDWWGSRANLWKQMRAASAGESVIAASCAQQLGSLLVFSGNRGHLSCTCRWLLRGDIARHH